MSWDIFSVGIKMEINGDIDDIVVGYNSGASLTWRSMQIGISVDVQHEHIELNWKIYRWEIGHLNCMGYQGDTVAICFVILWDIEST